MLIVSFLCLKWWPGGLGYVATHAVVQARLIIGEKDYGIHGMHNLLCVMWIWCFLMCKPSAAWYDSNWWDNIYQMKSSLQLITDRLATIAFIVQLRSLENHSTLPGIVIGDIGLKFGNGGNNSVDNGFMRFNSVCIPRKNMLMRWVRFIDYTIFVPVMKHCNHGKLLLMFPSLTPLTKRKASHFY